MKKLAKNASVEESKAWWLQRRNLLQKEHLSEFEEPLSWHLDNKDFIKDSQIRPGELGQWDMYYFLLQSGFGPPELAAKAVCLDIKEIKQEQAADDARVDRFLHDLCVGMN